MGDEDDRACLLACLVWWCCCLLRALLFPLSDHANDLALLALESEAPPEALSACLTA